MDAREVLSFKGSLHLDHRWVLVRFSLKWGRKMETAISDVGMVARLVLDIWIATHEKEMLGLEGQDVPIVT